MYDKIRGVDHVLKQVFTYRTYPPCPYLTLLSSRRRPGPAYVNSSPCSQLGIFMMLPGQHGKTSTPTLMQYSIASHEDVHLEYCCSTTVLKQH